MSGLDLTQYWSVIEAILLTSMSLFCYAAFRNRGDR